MNKTLLIFFTLIFCFSKAQVFQRFSDGKTVDSVTVINNGSKNLISQSNFKNYQFQEGDKVLYDKKLLDFAMNNDTLVFFDKMKEIEGVEIVKFDGKKKNISSSKLKRSSAEIFANNRVASLIQIKSDKKTFVKSLVLLINKFQMFENYDGILRVQILKNLNGFPDDSSELVSFEKDMAEMADRKPFTHKKIQFDFPKIIKYPKEGFFVVLYLKTDKKHTVLLTQNDESPMFMYYPNEGWKKLNFNGYYYQLKILQ